MGGAALEFGTSKPVTALRGWFSLVSSATAILEVILKLAMKIQLLKRTMNILEVIWKLAYLPWSFLCSRTWPTLHPRAFDHPSAWQHRTPGPARPQHSLVLGDAQNSWFSWRGPKKLTPCAVLHGFSEWAGVSEPSSVVIEFINSATASGGVCKGAAITPGVPGRPQLQSICSEVLTISWPLPRHPRDDLFLWTTV